MKLSELIRTKRATSGMTLQEVADACGLSKSHMHALETDQNLDPGIYTCARLSIALNIPMQMMGCAILESRNK